VIFMGKLTAPRYVYTAVRVRDMKRSIALFSEALGMKMQFTMKIKRTGGRVAFLKSPGGKQILELNWYPKPAYRKGDQLDHLAFRVPDLKATHLALLAHGARVVIPTFREGGIRLTFYEDRDGVPLEIMSSAKGRFNAK
jgi:catechol 2,3-dioxygenase-like lactoylglutathione lyase family enzyme